MGAVVYHPEDAELLGQASRLRGEKRCDEAAHIHRVRSQGQMVCQSVGRDKCCRWNVQCDRARIDLALSRVARTVINASKQRGVEQFGSSLGS